MAWFKFADSKLQFDRSASKNPKKETHNRIDIEIEIEIEIAQSKRTHTIIVSQFSAFPRQTTPGKI